MSILNAALRPLFDAVLYPFRELSPLVGILLMSLVFAIGVLLVVKKTSDQDKLAAVKRRIHAGLFEIRLFNDDLRAILGAMVSILRHNATYLWLWLVPLLWMLVPMVLFLGQLQFHYGYKGLEPGQTFLFTAETKDKGGSKPAVELEVPEGLTVETRPVWIPAEGELVWRMRADTLGDYQVGVRIDGESYTKEVQVADNVRRRSPVRVAPGFFDELLYPAEEPLPAEAPLRSIALDYPPGDGGISGWDSEITWMAILFLASMVIALALSKPLGVTI